MYIIKLSVSRKIIISVVLFCLFFVGSFFYIFNGIDNNPAKHVSEKWEYGINRYIFTWKTSTDDIELSDDIKKYVIGFKENKDELNTLDPFRLRILRNMFFAIHGYDFKDPELKDYFSRFKWYHPKSSVNAGFEELNNYEAEVVKEILKHENNNKYLSGNFGGLDFQKQLIPSIATNYMIWDFKKLDPHEDLPEILSDVEDFKVKDTVDWIFKLFEKVGIHSETIKSASIFSLPNSSKNEFLPFEVILESSEIDSSIVATSLRNTTVLEDIGSYKVLAVNPRYIIAVIDNGFIVCSSKESLKMITDVFEGNAPGISLKNNLNDIKSDPAITMKFDYLSSNIISVGPKNIGAENITVNLYKNKDRFTGFATGKLSSLALNKSLRERIKNTGIPIRYGYFPLVETWPEIFLRSSKSTDYNFSLIDQSFEVTVEW